MSQAGSGLYVPAALERATPTETSVTARDRIGSAAAYFFGREADWSRRHVETVEIHSERYAKRQLTVDLELPNVETAALDTRCDPWAFLVPMAFLAKRPVAGYIDCVDENEATLPLLNRDQNAEISFEALTTAVESRVGTLPEFVEDSLFGLIFDEPDEGLYYLHEFVAYAERTPKLKDDLAYPRLKSLATELAGNSCLWTRLSGNPGERRVIKLRYDTEIGPPALFVRSRRSRTVEVFPADGHAERVELPPTDDPGPSSILRRFWARLATSFGWSAIDLYLPSPHVRDTDSYHLQITAPAGLEMRGVELLADVRRDGEPVYVRAPDDESRLTGHLYFSDAEVADSGPAVVILRVGRRGLLSWSLLGSTLLTVMLVLLASSDKNFDDPRAGTQAQIIAAVLLIVPAILAAFIVRPGENALARRLLSGIRLLLLVEGLTSVAAAVALADVWPEAPRPQEVWRDAAAVCASLTALFAVAWLSSLVLVWRGYRAVRRARAALPLPVLAWDCLAGGFSVLAAAVLVIAQSHDPVRLAPWALAGTVLALLAWFIAPMASPGLASVLDVVAVVLIIACGVVAAGVVPIEDGSLWVFCSGAVLWFFTALGGVAFLRVLLRSRRESSERS